MTMSSGDGATFYGVHIPPGITVPEDINVEMFYTDKLAALKVLKKVKPARMKRFSTSLEAAQFHGSRDVCSPTPVQPDADSHGRGSGNASSSGPNSAWSSVRFQDLVKLRQAIERGQVEKVEEMVNSNPRYLIGSGDTPTILQERFRYNGLHSAAIKGQAAVAEVILNYMNDLPYYMRLYPGDSEESRCNRMFFAMDLYLNTPDKGFNETPLHFASKYGFADMVELLANEPLVNKLAVNKDQQTAADIVCTRAKSQENKARILRILQGQYYVPLYRSTADDMIPVVGDLWTPNGQPRPRLNCYSPELMSFASPLRLKNRRRLPRIASNTTSRNAHRLSSTDEVTVRAVAGPMSSQQAKEFRRNWSSPGTPRCRYTRQVGMDSPLSNISRRDPYKGLELVGRSLASEMQVPWVEYWDFLRCAADLRQERGLKILEGFLRIQEWDASDGDLSDEEGQSDEDTESEQEDALTEGEEDELAGTTGDLAHPSTSAIDSGAAAYQTSGLQGEGDALDTTDDQISTLFGALSIHSPASPTYGVYQGCHSFHLNNDLNSQQTAPADDKPKVLADDKSKVEVNGVRAISSPTECRLERRFRRSLLECIVPSVSSYIDTLRAMWPFSQGSATRIPAMAKASSPASETVTGSDSDPETVTRSDSDPETVTDSDADPGIIMPTNIASEMAGCNIPSPHISDGDVISECDVCKCKQVLKPHLRVFLKGKAPCKVDRDVVEALRGVHICQQSYPCIHSWYTNTTAFSSQVQNSWESPLVLRHRERMRKIQTRTRKRRLVLK